jgi:diacylglycerol kinase (ATP)
MAMQPFGFGARLNSFRFAFNGLRLMVSGQHNAWVHAAATLAVVLAGALLRIPGADWRWLLVAIALVWITETLNTAFEHLCDVVSPEFNMSVQKCKDVAAGAVLIAAISAAAIGATVFWPHVVRWL